MWYYARGDQQVGPVEEDVFARLAGEGAFTPETLVWREGMTDWVRLDSLRDWGAAYVGTGGAMGHEGGVRCVHCGQYVPADQTIAFEGQSICAACKPIYFQRLREGNALPGNLVYASILRRFGALVLDSLIFNALFLVLFLGLGFAGVAGSGGGEPSEAVAMLMGFTIILGGLGGFTFYMTWFVGRFGATPGKMALRIKIVRGDGARVTYARAFGRMLAHQLSGMILYLGFLVAFFDDERRALHDMICDTRVIEI